MKILFVHNNYGNNNSGEEHASQGLADLLIKNGHTVQWYRKSSDIIQDSFKMKIAAFFSGIYNPKAVKELKSKILDFKTRCNSGSKCVSFYFSWYTKDD